MKNLFGVIISLFFFASVTYAVQFDDSGWKQTKSGIWYRLIMIKTNNVDYGFQFLSKEEPEPEGTTLIGIGVRYPTKRGWYENGFVNIYLGEESIFGHTAKIDLNLVKGIIEVCWDVEGESIKMLFTAEDNSDNFSLEIKNELKIKNIPIRVEFCCYPGDYKKKEPDKRDRWIATAKRQISHGEGPTSKRTVTLDPEEEYWIFYYDKKLDPIKLGKWSATCGLLYSPDEPEKVEVEIWNYPIKTRFYYPARVKSMHYVLWEFAGISNSQAMEYMKKLEIGKTTD